MGRPLTSQTLENAAMRALYLAVKDSDSDPSLRVKAATAILQVLKKIGTRPSPVLDEKVVGEEEEDVPELKGMSNRELRDLIEEK